MERYNMTDCLNCDCYDPDMGCTMPSVDKSYACLLETATTSRRSNEKLKTVNERLKTVNGRLLILPEKKEETENGF